MPKLRKRPKSRTDSQGNIWTSRDPRTIYDILNGGDIKQIEPDGRFGAASLPSNISRHDIERLMQGTNLQRGTFLETLERFVPVIDNARLALMGALAGIGIGAQYVTDNAASQVGRSVQQTIDGIAPETYQTFFDSAVSWITQAEYALPAAGLIGYAALGAAFLVAASSFVKDGEIDWKKTWQKDIA